jgi:hypothetical protein
MILYEHVAKYKGQGVHVGVCVWPAVHATGGTNSYQNDPTETGQHRAPGMSCGPFGVFFRVTPPSTNPLECCAAMAHPVGAPRPILVVSASPSPFKMNVRGIFTTVTCQVTYTTPSAMCGAENGCIWSFMIMLQSRTGGG